MPQARYYSSRRVTSQASTLIVQISGANKPIYRDCHTPVPDPCPQIARRFAPHRHIERSIKHPYPYILRCQRVQFSCWEFCNSTRDLFSSAKETKVLGALLRKLQPRKHTIQAANKGKPSIAFKWAPLARARVFNVAAGRRVLRVSRFVRGVMLVAE